MGSEISSLVGEYLAYAGYPHSLQKKVVRKFGKAVKGNEKVVLESLQAGDPNDHGRNETKILPRLPPHVQLRAFRFLFETAFAECLLLQAVSRKSGVSMDEVIDAACMACVSMERRVYGAGAELFGAGDQSPGDCLVVVREGSIKVTLVRTTGDFVGSASTDSVLELGMRRSDMGEVGGRVFPRAAAALVAEGPVVCSVVNREALQQQLGPSRALHSAFFALRQEAAEEQQREEDQRRRAAAEQRRRREAQRQSETNAALFHAVEACDQEGVAELVSRGAQIDAVSEQSGRTPLYVACLYQHLSLVHTLLRLGASVDQHTHNSRRTAMHAAAELGWVEGVKALLDAGASPYAPDDSGTTPLHVAAQRNHVGALRAMARAAARAGMDGAAAG
eukprot:CAMPEP_0196770746 /NCGR_PEP_ID=MMETSP1104-20130614/1311_1 /TAXON_ID=33652 /ORGANISM="Cafeteria sp., Strain Caron Lab Isolate" /LENGTH=390 /DNA_ID=CAMNT_0042140861 /DNA_START=108 /DNA_END=1276 /DNA_ORIENTATION=+